MYCSTAAFAAGDESKSKPLIRRTAFHRQTTIRLFFFQDTLQRGLPLGGLHESRRNACIAFFCATTPQACSRFPPKEAVPHWHGFARQYLGPPGNSTDHRLGQATRENKTPSVDRLRYRVLPDTSGPDRRATEPVRPKARRPFRCFRRAARWHTRGELAVIDRGRRI